MESRDKMIRRLLAPPVFEGDEEKTRIASLLNTILLTQFLVTVIPAVNLVFAPAEGPFFLIPIAFILPLVAMIIFMHRGHIRAVSIALIIFLLMIAALLGVFSGGKPQVVITYYPLIIVIAGLLLGGNSAVITALVSSAMLGIITYVGSMGYLPEVLPPLPTGIVLITYTVGFTLIGIVFRLASNSLDAALTRARMGERQLTESNRELQKFSASLEATVLERTEELAERRHELEIANVQLQRRTRQFEAVAQVTQAITSIRDLQELLPKIATVISENFDFYHVGVFLLDDVNEYAVMTATNSEGGRQMLARHHRLRIGEQGIVGTVAATGAPRIAMDVGEDAVFFDNQELPDTHSEMALPLRGGNLVIGILDVQSTQRGAFIDEDVQMLSLLANQVSIAIENARLFEETSRALSESEAVSRQTILDTWRKLPAEQNLLGYRYTLTGAAPLHQPLDLSEVEKSRSKAGQSEASQIVVPIELRGERIGSLVVQSPTGAAELDQDRIDLIKAVAERVAISAENARLFDETTRRAERERTVSDITGKIRSVNDPQAMIQIAIEELRNALGATRVEVVPQTIQGSQ
jgi:GAF domain-containing protein